MKNVYIGFIGTTITAISLLPSVYSSTIKKNTHGINYLYIILGFIAQSVWLFYGIRNNDLPVTILAGYLMTVYIIMSASKWYYEATNQDMYSQLKSSCRKLQNTSDEDEQLLSSVE